MRQFLSILLVGSGLFMTAPASAAVNIFACEPEWGALAEDIGGDLVSVYNATNAHQDVHHMQAKPSLLAAMRKADLVFCSGASLESGWLPILLQKAGGPEVQPETLGWLMASEYVDKLDVMQHVDRSMGHIHPEGNPHIHLDPRNIQIAAGLLADRLGQIDPEHAQDYFSQLETFETAWTTAMKNWDAQAANLKGQRVVVYHNHWAYLLQWLGMTEIASLEPKPGVPPTAAHLDKVLNEVKGQNVKAILVAPFENRKAADWLSAKTGIPVIELPFTVGGNDAATGLKGLFDNTLQLIEGAK